MSEPLLRTSREEYDGYLRIVEGKLPKGLSGVFYASYPVGSVNSGGLPFPKELPNGEYNREYGSPLMNGDGMALKVDFNKVRPRIKQRLLKTPCYYADYHSRFGTERHKLFGFSNFGISRMSMLLGARNELNTAMMPVRFKEGEPLTMLATYDVGRPFFVDSKSLKLLSPLGWSKEYKDTQPGMVPWPFGVQETTAHPCFDPNASELFLVNYTRDSQSFVQDEKTIHHLKNNRETLKEKLHDLADSLHEKVEKHEALSQVKHFFTHLDSVIKGDKYEELEEEMSDKTATVYLMKWTGEGELKKWLLKDQNGNSLKIVECMHQMGMTQDYIILTDCSFKFSTDLMVNNPFPKSHKLDAFMRWMLSTPMEPFTTTYIVKRADLKEGVQEVVATQLDKPIPVETIHYSMNYANPNGEITMYGIHNAAVCVAEWLRAFDTELLSGNDIDPEVISLFAIGSMDLSRFGKWVMNGETGKLLEDKSKEYVQKGKVDDDNIGPNSWSIGLYGHRDLISGDIVPEEVKCAWFVANGTDPRMLSKFIYELYKEYPNRILDIDEVKRCTELNLPFGIVRVDTDKMEAGDYYQCPHRTYIRSIQFANNTTPTPGVPEELDGYLVCTVQVGEEQKDKSWDYTSQIWVFDATDVSKGPVCKMEHRKMKFCFTLHSAWIPEAQKSEMEYKVDIKEDYNEVLKNMEILDPLLKPFFIKNVYPYFK